MTKVITYQKLTITSRFAGKPKNKNLTWRVTGTDGISDVSGIAEISSKGVLAGKAEGTVRVTAVSEANPSIESFCDIFVYVPVKKIALSASKGTVSTDKSFELSVIVTSTVSGHGATGERPGEEPSVEYTVDNKKYVDKLVIEKRGNTAVIRAAEGAGKIKNIPVKATIKAYNGYKKTLTCKVTTE